MKAVIIYRSTTGFTEKYAKWLAESLSCRAVSYEKRRTVNLKNYDVLIYGGSFCAGVIGGLRWFKKEAAGLAGAVKIVLAVGAMPADAPEVQQAVAANLSEEERLGIKVFYLQGGLSYEKMGLRDRLMMKAFVRMMEKQAGKAGAAPEQKKLAEAVSHSYDLSDREFLEPVISYVRSCG